jgi:hypothetical protein
MFWYTSIYVAVVFLKLFARDEITKGTISVSPRDGQPGQLAGAPAYEEHYSFTGIIGNMAPVHSGFHKRKNFTKSDLQFGHITAKVLVIPVLGRKCFLSTSVLRSAKLLACMVHQITELLGVPSCLG